MSNEQLEQDQSISLGEIFNLIKKNFFILAAATLLGGLILGIYAFQFASPKYKSTGQIIVKDENVSNNVDMTGSLRYVPTVIDVLTNVEDVALEAKKTLEERDNIKLSLSEVKKNLSVKNNVNSLVISISYTSVGDKYADKVVDHIIDALFEVVGKETEETKILKDKIHRYQTISDPVKVAPNKMLLILVGLLLGGTVSLVAVITLEIINSGIKTEEELVAYTNMQILGSIPEFNIKEESGRA